MPASWRGQTCRTRPYRRISPPPSARKASSCAACSRAPRRRLYINGYVRAGACGRGEWTFRDGLPVPLGPKPALVHDEQLRERPEPHYV